MSRAATDWVFSQSRARGAARLVLLAIADRIGADGRAYAGTASLMRRTLAARSTVRNGVDALLASGELAVVEGEIGPGGETVYRLPRLDVQGAGQRPGPDFDPGRTQAPGGPETSPQNKRSYSLQEQQQPRASSAALIPELRPLDTALVAASVTVRWCLGLGEQRDVVRLVQAHGVEALVGLAARRTVSGEAPKAARYWLKVWSDLDRPVNTSPRTVPSAAAYADNLAAGLALLNAQKEHTP